MSKKALTLMVIALLAATAATAATALAGQKKKLPAIHEVTADAVQQSSLAQLRLKIRPMVNTIRPAKPR